MDKRSQTIQNMFSEIAGSYDKANSVLSLGIHHLWKKELVRKSQVQPGMSVLDCATGTGDLALLFKKEVGAHGRVIGSDFCQEMLDQAPDKAKKAGLDIEFQWADVCQLSYEDNEFDRTSISFGIRNVESLEKALSELARVTRPGGKVMILEFGQMNMPGIKQAYNFYSQRVLPRIGGLVSGKPKAYQYLNDSSQVFPCGDDFKDIVLSTGSYSEVQAWPLSLGIAYIYSCTVK